MTQRGVTAQAGALLAGQAGSRDCMERGAVTGHPTTAPPGPGGLTVWLYEGAMNYD